MPYVLAETIDAVGNKELLAAPETWILRYEDGKVYLCWPNVRNINMLNALLADERSSPLDAWETHECVIKCSNIQSLSVAGKMIKTLQNHWKTVGSAQKRTITTNDNAPTEPVCKKSPNNYEERQQSKKCSKHVPSAELETGEAQIIGMLTELKRLIEKRHGEARKKLHDGFYRVEKSLLTVVNDSQDVLYEQEAAAQDNAPRSANVVEFYVNPITGTEEMRDFEERLNDAEYRKQVQHWIDCTIGNEIQPENRMRGILDALFDKHFLSNFSWTGNRTGTLAFMQYKNIVNLFAYAGTTAVGIVTPRYVAQFFIKELQRATLRATHKHISPSLATEASLSSLNEAEEDSQHSDDNAEFSLKPLTCIEELDAFETKMDDVKYRAQVHKWTNDHVAFEINPEARMREILYLLFDHDFLERFTWTGARKGSYGMQRYNNVVRLFKYVGTTTAHRADYTFVATFFNKKLKCTGKRAKPSS